MAPVDPEIKTTHVKLSQHKLKGQCRAQEQLPKSQTETTCPNPRGFSQQGICCSRKVPGRQEEASFTLPCSNGEVIWLHYKCQLALGFPSRSWAQRDSSKYSRTTQKQATSTGCSCRATATQDSTVSWVVPLLAQHTLCCVVLLMFGIISIRPTIEDQYIILL